MPFEWSTVASRPPYSRSQVAPRLAMAARLIEGTGAGAGAVPSCADRKPAPASE